MLTPLGASLMFFAVVTVELARLAAKPARQLPQLGAVAEAELMVEGSQSLASFAASEYAERKAGLALKNVFGIKVGFWGFLSPLRKMPWIFVGWSYGDLFCCRNVEVEPLSVPRQRLAILPRVFGMQTAAAWVLRRRMWLVWLCKMQMASSIDGTAFNIAVQATLCFQVPLVRWSIWECRMRQRRR